MDDPLVEEARKADQAYLDSFKGDRNALLEDLRRREKASGRRIVNLPPKPARIRPSKKSA